MALSEKIRRSEFSAEDRKLGRPELTPLGKCSGAVELDIVPWAAGVSQIEVVVDGGMDGGAFLEASHPPETEHLMFSSPERQVEILRTIVQPAASLMQT